MMNKQVRSDEARRNLRDLLDEVAHHDAHITILRYDKPAAVLVSPEWLEHTRAALAAFGEADDPPVSANQVRYHVSFLGGLLDGMRKDYDFAPGGKHRDIWQKLQAEVDGLAALLPENAELASGEYPKRHEPSAGEAASELEK